MRVLYDGRWCGIVTGGGKCGIVTRGGKCGIVTGGAVLMGSDLYDAIQLCLVLD